MRTYRTAAERRLDRLRRGGALAVGLTAILLLATHSPDRLAADTQIDTAQVDTTQVDSVAADTLAIDTAEAPADTVVVDPGQAVEEATGTLRELYRDFMRVAPKLVIALVLLALAGLLSGLLRPVLRRAFGSWSKGAAASAGIGILIWVLALSAALAVITGDARTLLGSVGLLGLALSWALQAPIESFSAWVFNSFREYYRVGDRIAVGDVFGDVHRIDLLTTTVWESGRPDGDGVGGATGGLITFPNSEVLRANIVNYTRDFPWVWDEVVVGVANESDLRYAMERARDVAMRVVGGDMKAPATAYRELLKEAGLEYDVSDEPEVFLSATDSWTNVAVRYLVPARARRSTRTRMLLELSEDFAAPENATRIIGSYPRQRVDVRQVD